MSSPEEYTDTQQPVQDTFKDISRAVEGDGTITSKATVTVCGYETVVSESGSTQVPDDTNKDMVSPSNEPSMDSSKQVTLRERTVVQDDSTESQLKDIPNRMEQFHKSYAYNGWTTKAMLAKGTAIDFQMENYPAKAVKDGKTSGINSNGTQGHLKHLQESGSDHIQTLQHGSLTDVQTTNNPSHDNSSLGTPLPEGSMGSPHNDTLRHKSTNNNRNLSGKEVDHFRNQLLHIY